MDNMNQFVYEKTTADPEAHLSQFEPKSEMLNKKKTWSFYM